MTQQQPTINPPSALDLNTLRLFDRTVGRRLHQVLRGHPFRFGDRIGYAQDQLAGEVVVRWADGREDCLPGAASVQVPYAPPVAMEATA